MAAADTGRADEAVRVEPRHTADGRTSGVDWGTNVEVDAMVLLKILRHCQEHAPSVVNGQLLGFDRSPKLEITNCYPLQNRQEPQSFRDRDRTERQEEVQLKYQARMVDLLHEVQMDCFTVGWYQTMTFSDMNDESIVDALVAYHQESDDSAVVIGYDPLSANMGHFPFKAFRAAKEFLDTRGEDGSVVPSKLKGEGFVLEAVGIRVQHSPLASMFLRDAVRRQKLQLSPVGDYGTLTLDNPEYLRRSLTLWTQSIDELQLEQGRVSNYLKDVSRYSQQIKAFLENRKMENDQRRLRGEAALPVDNDASGQRKPEAPSLLPTLLGSFSVQAHCAEFASVTKENIANAFLLEGVLTAISQKSAADRGQ